MAQFPPKSFIKTYKMIKLFKPQELVQCACSKKRQKMYEI